MCKHVAALLYHIAQEVECGKNKACTSNLQKWHRPRNDLIGASCLTDVSTPKASNLDHGEKKRARRDTLDIHPVELQKTKKIADYDLAALYAKTEGKAAALLYVDVHGRNEPDLRDVVHEEVVG